MSTVITDNLTGKTAAGDVTITDGSVTFKLQDGMAKAWLAFATDSSQSITGDTFNVSSYSDTGTGTSEITVVNAFNNALYPVQNTATSNYPYQGKALTASTFQLRTINASGNSADGAKNAVAHGDLA